MTAEPGELVGKLKRLRRFPVEPLSGEEPEETRLDGDALTGDRLHELVDVGTGEALLASAAPVLLTYSARQSEELLSEDVDEWTRVVSPEGDEFHLGDPLWTADLGRRLGRAVAVRRRRRLGPSAPGLPLVTNATLDLAERAYGSPIEPVRLRFNLVVELRRGKAFQEDSWIGLRLRVGDSLFEVRKSSGRAVVTAFRPESAQGDIEMLDALLQVHGGTLGVDIRPIAGRHLRVGDPVSLVR